MSRPFVVIAGGGTAGHTLPALAVARELAQRRGPGSVHFVGSRRGMEATLVPEAGYPITLLPGRGIPAGPSLQGVVSAGAIVWAVVLAVALLIRRRPRVVLSVGGYAGLPCSLAAAALRIPLVLAEQNAVPGRANRLVSRFAASAACAFPDTDLPRAVTTGNPLRPEVENVDRSPEARAAAKAALGADPSRLLVAATGGSLGARRINDAVAELARMWSDRRDVAFHHIVGRRDWAALAGRLPSGEGDGLAYRAVEYEQDMPTVLSAADVMVCRGGGSTVAELAAVGVPSVLVPLPIAPGDHQRANAEVLADRGGAVVLDDRECTAERLAAVLGGLLADGGRLEAMGDAARAVGVKGAAGRVADLVEAAAAGRRGGTS